MQTLGDPAETLGESAWPGVEAAGRVQASLGCLRGRVHWCCPVLEPRVSVRLDSAKPEPVLCSPTLAGVEVGGFSAERETSLPRDVRSADNFLQFFFFFWGIILKDTWLASVKCWSTECQAGACPPTRSSFPLSFACPALCSAMVPGCSPSWLCKPVPCLLYHHPILQPLSNILEK